MLIYFSLLSKILLYLLFCADIDDYCLSTVTSGFWGKVTTRGSFVSDTVYRPSSMTLSWIVNSDANSLQFSIVPDLLSTFPPFSFLFHSCILLWFLFTDSKWRLKIILLASLTSLFPGHLHSQWEVTLLSRIVCKALFDNMKLFESTVFPISAHCSSTAGRLWGILIWIFMSHEYNPLVYNPLNYVFGY